MPTFHAMSDRNDARVRAAVEFGRTGATTDLILHYDELIQSGRLEVLLGDGDDEQMVIRFCDEPDALKYFIIVSGGVQRIEPVAVHALH